MTRDWVVWLGCFLLFGCGAVWAQIPIKTDFFVVDNIHDLFEILGALATIVAVCVAAASINSWKHQVNAVADLELARNLVISLHRYKDSIVGMWAIAEFAAAQAQGSEQPPIELSEPIDADFQKSLDELSEAQLEVKDLLLRCQSVWRINLSSDSKDLFRFADRCSLTVRNYLLLSRKIPASANMARRVRKAVTTHWSWFEENGCDTYELAIARANDLSARLEKRIEKKLSVA
ncbi:hypothetical protein [Pseudomonas mandelii]|uniref:DUF4760 domain-containing protein n=1 Tax=Pseudomonas mandelii TaxID=75612 RepID=A0ABY0VVB7_9PSED|nr:hypothetical protein [Pseudomonas mandelii]TWS02808.1 hypothetical protein FJD35_31720 [Pseudomonas mandelii]SDU57968.1 hypothetical protein SAMN04489801_4664 [Pseudomonas mandelii]